MTWQLPWSFSAINWSCRTWISVDMPISIKETRTNKKTIPCPIILRFWSNKENAKRKAKRSAHIKKQDCSRGLLFLYPFIVWVQAAPGWWIITIHDALYTCTAHYSGTIIHLQMFVNTFCYKNHGKDDLPYIKRIDWCFNVTGDIVVCLEISF